MSVVEEAPTLPYFGGTVGHACRLAAVEAWKAKNDTTKATLDAVMATELYQTAKAHCQAEIEIYDRASAVVCLLEKDTLEGTYNVTYNEFWEGSSYYYDGALDLATLFAPTTNFTETGTIVPCITDCYLSTGITGNNGNGCPFSGQGWLTHVGKIPVEEYCSLQWAGIDNAYLAIKVCASEAIGNPTKESGLSKEEYVGKMQSQQATNVMCAYQSCNTDVFESVESVFFPVSADTSGGIETHYSLGGMGVIAAFALLVQFKWLG